LPFELGFKLATQVSNKHPATQPTSHTLSTLSEAPALCVHDEMSILPNKEFIDDNGDTHHGLNDKGDVKSHKGDGV
jgi:hypothetical protein